MTAEEAYVQLEKDRVAFAKMYFEAIDEPSEGRRSGTILDAG